MKKTWSTVKKSTVYKDILMNWNPSPTKYTCQLVCFPAVPVILVWTQTSTKTGGNGECKQALGLVIAMVSTLRGRSRGMNELWNTKKLSQRSACRIAKDLRGDLDFGVIHCTTVQPKVTVKEKLSKRRKLCFYLEMNTEIETISNAMISNMTPWTQTAKLNFRREFYRHIPK